MANRREVLTGVAAVSALPVAGPGRAAATELHPYKLLVDTRFAEGRAAAARSVLPVEALADGDVTAFWARDLAPRWRAGPAALSGVTTPDTLHCLELLAATCRAGVTVREPVGGLVAWTIAPIRRA
jgi:hypothetical protein